MSAAFTESVVEDAALAWLEALGYAVRHGPEIAAGDNATIWPAWQLQTWRRGSRATMRCLLTPARWPAGVPLPC